MKQDSFVARFTPSILSAETLEAIFVKREKLAARLVDLIRESALTDNKHYVLLVGPRGIGKTHLVSLVYHRVKADQQVADRLLVAWLREEEWGVSSFLDLLLRILRALREEENDKDLAAECDRLRTLSAGQAELDAQNLLKRTVGKRTLLLIAENLDDIFNGLGDDGQERLRAYIQNNPFFTILATSQSLFSGVSLRTSPFYAFFETQHLDELGFEDAVSLVAKIADGIEEARAKLEHFSMLHPNLLAHLAEIYSGTISNLQPRIMVRGEPSYLQNPDNQNRIRTMLLAGIRAAWLWRQVGGSRWTILLGRRRLLDSAEAYLRGSSH